MCSDLHMYMHTYEHTHIYTHKEKMGGPVCSIRSRDDWPMLLASTKLKEARESPLIIVEQRGLASTLILASGSQEQDTIHLLF